MNNQELLYHYFSNSLTPEQESVFKKLLETDAEFKAEFEFEKGLQKAIKSHETDRLKAMLNEVETKINKRHNTVFNYRNLAIAASIAILFGWFGYNTFFSTNYSSLYEDNFTEYPNTVYTITRSDDANSIEREAFVAYETKNYQTAIEKFEALSADKTKDYLNFYKAQAYLGMDNIQEAKGLFQQVVAKNESFVAEATWYLALIAIKEKDKSLAVSYLEHLMANYSYNKDKAQALLKELN